MIHDFPEHKQLENALVRSRNKFTITLDYIDSKSLEGQPSRTNYIYNPSGQFDEELNALHQAIWELGNKVSMNVIYSPGYVRVCAQREQWSKLGF